MKTNIFQVIITLLFIAVLLIACNDDNKTPIPPTFKGFKHTPEVVHPGDAVTVIAFVDQPGKYVYGPRYTWTISMDTLSTKGSAARMIYTIIKEAYISDGDPQVTFTIPQNIITTLPVNVNFKADYNNSVDANERISLPCNVQDGYEGRFNSSEVLSTLYSVASGSMSFYIK